jgi:hypothetical protein
MKQEEEEIIFSLDDILREYFSSFDKRALPEMNKKGF